MSAPTAKQVAAGQVRTLRAMREKLLTMADQWEGVDEFNRTRLTQMADLADEIGAEFVPVTTATKAMQKVGVEA